MDFAANFEELNNKKHQQRTLFRTNHKGLVLSEVFLPENTPYSKWHENNVHWMRLLVHPTNAASLKTQQEEEGQEVDLIPVESLLDKASVERIMVEDEDGNFSLRSNLETVELQTKKGLERVERLVELPCKMPKNVTPVLVSGQLYVCQHADQFKRLCDAFDKGSLVVLMGPMKHLFVVDRIFPHASEQKKSQRSSQGRSQEERMSLFDLRNREELDAEEPARQARMDAEVRRALSNSIVVKSERASSPSPRETPRREEQEEEPMPFLEPAEEDPSFTEPEIEQALDEEQEEPRPKPLKRSAPKKKSSKEPSRKRSRRILREEEEEEDEKPKAETGKEKDEEEEEEEENPRDREVFALENTLKDLAKRGIKGDLIVELVKSVCKVVSRHSKDYDERVEKKRTSARLEAVDLEENNKELLSSAQKQFNRLVALKKAVLNKTIEKRTQSAGCGAPRPLGLSPPEKTREVVSGRRWVYSTPNVQAMMVTHLCLSTGVTDTNCLPDPSGLRKKEGFVVDHARLFEPNSKCSLKCYASGCLTGKVQRVSKEEREAYLRGDLSFTWEQDELLFEKKREDFLKRKGFLVKDPCSRSHYLPEEPRKKSESQEEEEEEEEKEEEEEEGDSEEEEGEDL